jgi:tetratricopeptide (TPR) repeat protein
VEANLGLAYYAGHQYPQAIEALQSALKRDPALGIAKGFLPVSQAAAGDCAQAVPGFEREFASNSDVKLRRVLGLSLERCAAEAGDETQAVEVTQKLLAAFPDDPDVLFTAGQLYGRLSSEVNLKLMKVAPNSPRIYQLMASVAAADGNWQGAIDAYRKALHLEPRLQGAHVQIAILMLTHSQDPNAWHQALAELRDELKIDPSSAEAEYEIGEAYRKHEQLEPAVAAFRKALDLDPNVVPARLDWPRRCGSLAASPRHWPRSSPGIPIPMILTFTSSLPKSTAIWVRRRTPRKKWRPSSALAKSQAAIANSQASYAMAMTNRCWHCFLPLPSCLLAICRCLLLPSALRCFGGTPSGIARTSGEPSPARLAPDRWWRAHSTAAQKCDRGVAPSPILIVSIAPGQHGIQVVGGIVRLASIARSNTCAASSES